MDEEEITEDGGFKADDDELLDPIEGSPSWQFDEDSDDANFDKDH